MKLGTHLAHSWDLKDYFNSREIGSFSLKWFVYTDPEHWIFIFKDLSGFKPKVTSHLKGSWTVCTLFLIIYPVIYPINIPLTLYNFSLSEDGLSYFISQSFWRFQTCLEPISSQFVKFFTLYFYAFVFFKFFYLDLKKKKRFTWKCFHFPVSH